MGKLSWAQVVKIGYFGFNKFRKNSKFVLRSWIFSKICEFPHFLQKLPFVDVKKGCDCGNSHDKVLLTKSQNGLK